MKKINYFPFFIIVFFLAGCTSQSDVVIPSPTSSARFSEVLPSITMKSTRTVQPSPTLLPSVTPTPTSTVVPTLLVSGFDVVQKCISAQDGSPSDFDVYGSLIHRCEGGACTLDFHNQETVNTAITPSKPNPYFSRVSFSPDGKWFAYEEVMLKEGGYEVQGRRLRIVSANGEEMPVAHWESDWRLYRWKDPETLILELDSELDPEEKIWNGDEAHTLIFFKTLTGKTTELLFPALHNPYRGNLLLKGPQENYDPTFQRVAYLYGDPKSSYTHFSLWDVQADKLLWSRNSTNEILFGTDWSPDGQWLAVASEVADRKAELFIVSRDGEERQLTDLISAFPGMNIEIGYFDWSSDGRFISLWLNVTEGEYSSEWRFAILNVETGQLVDYCFPSSPNQYPYSIWSPNSQQVAIQSYESDNLGDYSLIVLDVEKNEARKIPGVGWLWGWMVNNP